ncbi:MAG: single-stranded DNA-binding protein [Anaerolineales bacterium]|nr:single-stranded DNA-binding protein [Anaerolineales bacterium]
MYQKITIAGNLGRDPEMRYLPSGQAVTDMSVATNRTYTDSNGQKVTETTWFRVSVWGARAETVNQYLKKGSKVLIDGYLRPDPESGGPRVWTRNDGTPAASFEMTAQNVTFLSSRSEDQAVQSQSPESSTGTVDEDDIPF